MEIVSRLAGKQFSPILSLEKIEQSTVFWRERERALEGMVFLEGFPIEKY